MPQLTEQLTKQRIRQAILARRRAMSPEEAQTKSQAIQDRLYALPEYESAQVLHCYVSSKDNEVDTHNLIKRALLQGKRVVVPLTDFDARSLHHVEIAGFDELKPGRYGLMEPKGDRLKRVDVSDLDLILVPGIAFDANGYRIGFGKGFYDRFLANAGAPKIGLAYQLQIVEDIPIESHDIRMDKVITEEHLYVT